MPHAVRALAIFTLLHIPLTSSAQVNNRPDLSKLPNLLNFEGQQTAGRPVGWGGGPPDTLFADDRIVHSGKWAARLERNAASANKFSTITLGIPVTFSGTRVELRGFLKTQDVSDYVGLWLREDGDTGTLVIDNMQNRGIKGTSDWTEYSIVLPLRPEATQLYFGVLSAGTGTTWADDLQLLVDGKPVWEAPVVVKPQTAIDLDHEFDAGSRITLGTLSRPQIENLATLGRVWGFLKYHHPAIVAGQRHWDYDLFREAPKILALPDTVAAAAELHKWTTSLGAVDDCSQCVSLNTAGLQTTPDVAWISDEKLLGHDLSQDLQRIYRSRKANKFFVSRAPNGNPLFDHEPAYPAIKLPDAGYQLLALYRYWNIIEYWYPNRNIVGEDWSGVLTGFIPRIALASTTDTYRTEMIALIARVNDTHANLWSSLGSRPPVGDCQLPVLIRFVEGSALVTGYPGGAEPAPPLKIGDVITDLDGTPVTELLARWRQYYADSNEAARLRDVARTMTLGACGPATVGVRRGSDKLTITSERVLSRNLQPVYTHDRAGDAFQKLSGDVAYLKLSSVKAAEAGHYVDLAAGTKGLVIDLRNYPSEFMVFAVGQLLVDKPGDFVRFTFLDVSNPGAFSWARTESLTPMKPHYSGKVVVLVDEVTQSQAEYTTMAFRSAGATVIGSTTAGADGDVSQIPLPGSLRTMISGIGIFYPDKTPTQRVGIVPDIEVRPTLAGMRAGRDEVLEAALRQILGSGVPAAQIEALASNPR